MDSKHKAISIKCEAFLVLLVLFALAFEVKTLIAYHLKISVGDMNN